MRKSKCFSQEEIELLSGNPYVASVSPSQVRFSQEFKELFIERRKSGQTIHSIFKEFGIDPDILGESRINGFVYQLNKRVRKSLGFEDRRSNRPSPDLSDTEILNRLKSLPMEEGYPLLLQQLKKMSICLDFLKKIQIISKEDSK